jgi:hypothetical protein
MSMATPLNNLPLKTQQDNSDTSDINDPMVQDVLNEFQEELMMSKKTHEGHVPPQQLPQHPQHPQHQQHQQQLQHPSNVPQQMHLPYYPQQPVNKYSINYNNDKFPYNYIDVELIKKTLIVVIIAVLIFYTNIMHTIYEKLPPYAYDITVSFDVYVKGLALFIVLYVLGFMQYT